MTPVVNRDNLVVVVDSGSILYFDRLGPIVGQALVVDIEVAISTSPHFVME